MATRCLYLGLADHQDQVFVVPSPRPGMAAIPQVAEGQGPGTAGVSGPVPGPLLPTLVPTFTPALSPGLRTRSRANAQDRSFRRRERVRMLCRKLSSML